MPLEPDSRTDIFSLGIVFFTMLLQRPAFEGEAPMDIIQAVLGHRLPPVSSVRLDIPEIIGRIIQKATAKTVSERFHSVSGLRHDLVEARRLLDTGDPAQLLNWEIATKDVCPFFTLPEVMVGRTAEHDAIVKVIDRAFKSRQASQRQNKHGIHHLSSLSEGQFASFDMSVTEGHTPLEDDNERSADGTTNSSDTAAGIHKAYKANTRGFRSPDDSYHNSIDSIGSPSPDADLKLSGKRISTTLESVSVVDSMNGEGEGSRSSSDSVGSMILSRNSGSNGNTRSQGRCEIITITGAAGLGKSRLIQSMQVEARQRGYFASSKFDQAAKTPFGPMLELLSSLFQQAFSESNIDPGFLQTLKQHVAPMWPTLHRVLNLPRFLLGAELPIRIASQTGTLSKSYKSLEAELGGSDSSPTRPHSNVYIKTLGARSSQDFLRAGSSTKSLPLMNTFLHVLRIFTRHKFICFCLADLHFADEESLELITHIISTRVKMIIIVAYRPENISSETMRRILNPS